MKGIRFFLFLMLFLISVLIISCDDGGGGGGIGIPPMTPDNLYPDKIETSLTPLLQWGSSINADHYDLFLEKDDSSPILYESTIISNKYQLATVLDYSSIYYWQVQAGNDYGTSRSDVSVFSTRAERKGNYIELKDIKTDKETEFRIDFYGNIADAKGIELKLSFDDSMIEPALSEGKIKRALSGPLEEALSYSEVTNNGLDIDIATKTIFSLDNELFLSLFFTSLSFKGVTAITINGDSRIIDSQFNTINFNKDDKGFIFVE